MAAQDLSAVLPLLEQLRPALQCYDRVKIKDIVARLVALRAPMGEQWQQLARLAAGIGELRLSRAAIDIFVKAAGDTAAAQYKKAALLTESGQWQAAYDLLCTLPDNVPNPASNAYSLGASSLMLGHLEEAKEHLGRAVGMRPQSGAAWLGLAMSADLANEIDLGDKIVSAERYMFGVPAGAAALYFYARGKVHADRAEHASAFAAFSHGAQLQKSTQSYNRGADLRNAEEATLGYSPSAIREMSKRQTERTDKAILISGLPRSGTTLVEHIITNHSEVLGGGEIARLELLGKEFGGTSFNAVRCYADANGLGPAARLWHHWLAELFSSTGRIVDKTLNNSRALGVAASVLPEAPLIWVTRDPIDRAWSCYRTVFSGHHPWSYDLEDIAHHFAIEDRLLEHWQNILEDRLLVIPYESMVTHPTTWIHRIMEHCGLAVEQQMFEPHENNRPVITASTAQVRRPIHREAIGSAAPYLEYLDPFVRSYQG